ncbi:RidA family protein [Mycolicibacterium sp.]|uniref:RidA family protein n=1 Tax=Mycolicibacterium sp. TaxID=2320850 RepID=UPI0037CB45A1
MSVNAPSSFVTPIVEHDGIAYLSGQLPRLDGELVHRGRVGDTVDVDCARLAASLAAKACVDVLRAGLGDRFARLLKITGFVASAPDFTEQGKVLDAASQVFTETMGAAGEHARSAIGVAQLPHGACVEIEVIAAVKG